jgi:hypothetical protein
MQKVDEGQDTEVGLPDGNRVQDHIDPSHSRARDGIPLDDVPISKVMQNDVDEHDTDQSSFAPGMVRGVDHDDPFHVTDRPRSSTAMQSAVERQLTAVTPLSNAAPDHFVPFQVE